MCSRVLARSALAALLVALVCAAPLRATDHYVDAANGSNTSGDGSAAAPWKTLTHALAHTTALPADTHHIHVAPGIYDAALGEVFPLSIRQNTAVEGAGAGLTTFRGVTAFPYPALLDVPGSVNPPGLPFALRGVTVASSSPGAGAGLSARGRTLRELVVEDFAYGIYGTQGLGLRDSTVRRCTRGIYSMIVAPPSGGYTLDATDCTITQCGTGVELEAFDATPPFATAFIQFSATRCVIEHCGVGARLYALHGSSKLHKVGADFFGSFTRVSDCGSAFDVEGHNWVLLSSCVVTRNGAGIAFGPQQDASVLLHNSIVWDNAGQDFDPPDVEARYSDLSQALPGVGNLSVDPGFVAPASGDYHLRSDSALIDAGDPATVGGLDPDGDPRRTDGDWNADARADIGIDEFNRVRIAASGAAVLGGTVALTVTAPAGSAAVGFLSLHTADVSLGALGSVLIGALGPALFDPESVLVLGSGAAPWTFVAAVPNDPLLLGLQAHFQGFGKAATFAGASLSNRLTLVVH